MLRRRTSSPETLRYASESPAGAGPSWCTRTSLVAQTAGHTRVAEVAQEAVARARLIPEDVRLVMAKVVAGYGVVGGLRPSAVVRVRRDYDPARDRGGPRGDVARDLVARNLHATRAKKRDADPREIPVEFRGSTRASIVLDRVTSHLEATYVFIKLASFEEHASAVVADRVSGDGASFSYVADVHAPRAARDVVANDLGVVVGPFRPEDGDARFTGAAYVVGDDLGAGRFEDNRADYGAVRDVVGDDPGAGRFFDEHAEVVACEVVGEDLRLGGVCGEDPTVIACEGIVRDSSVAFSLKNGDPRLLVVREIVIPDSIVETCSKPNPGAAVAHDMVTFNSSVSGAENINHDRPEALVRLLFEASDREARNAHVSHARAGELAGFEVHVAEDANSFRSKDLRAGRVRSGSGGRFDHSVADAAQLDPILADHHVLSMNSPDHDSVARIGSVDSLLDGLAWPNYRALRSGGADPRRQYHPACHQQGQSHGGQQHYGASHRKTLPPL